MSLLLITPAYADLDKAVELAEQGKVREGQLELIKIVKAADAGDPKSQLEFGLMWDLGYWLWQDNQRAIKWYKKSAEQGYTQAQLMMGTIYLGGVKTEFEKFGDVLTLVKKQLQTAANSIDRTEVRTRQMSRKLKDVEDMSTENAMDVLDLKK